MRSYLLVLMLLLAGCMANKDMDRTMHMSVEFYDYLKTGDYSQDLDFYYPEQIEGLPVALGEMYRAYDLRLGRVVDYTLVGTERFIEMGGKSGTFMNLTYRVKRERSNPTETLVFFMPLDEKSFYLYTYKIDSFRQVQAE